MWKMFIRDLGYGSRELILEAVSSIFHGKEVVCKAIAQLPRLAFSFKHILNDVTKNSYRVKQELLTPYLDNGVSVSEGRSRELIPDARVQARVIL